MSKDLKTQLATETIQLLMAEQKLKVTTIMKEVSIKDLTTVLLQ